MPDVENHYTPKEVSEKLKLNIKTVYKWIREGKLYAIKVGDVRRIPESVLLEFIKSDQKKEKG